MLCLKNALWLVKNSHVSWNIQSAQFNYTLIKFVYNIDSPDRFLLKSRRAFIVNQVVETKTNKYYIFGHFFEILFMC